MSNSVNSLDRLLSAEYSTLKSRGLGSVLVLALGTFAVGTDAFIVAAFLPAMADGLRVSTAMAGQSLTVFAATYALLAPVIATLTAQMPRRALLVAALTVLAAANFVSALAPNFSVLIASRILAAIGAASFTPTAGAASAALVRPELRGRALAVVIGGLTSATALGIPLGNLASHWLGWRAALAFVAAVSLLAGVCILLSMPKLAGNPRVPLRRRLAAMRHPGVRAVLPLTVLGMVACYTPYAYSVPMLHAVGVPATTIAVMFFMYGLGAVIGSLFSGYATDRWGPAPALTVTYIIMTGTLVGFGWLAASNSPQIQIFVGLLMLLWGASSWAQTPAQQHRLIAAAPQDAPLAISLNSSAIYLGIGLGTSLGGVAIPAGASLLYDLGGGVAFLALIFLRRTLSATP